MTAEPMSGKQAADGAMEFPISAEDAGARLDKWLSERIESLTRTRLKAMIEEGALARNGETFIDPSWKIREGELFTLTIPPVEAPDPKPEKIDLDIRYGNGRWSGFRSGPRPRQPRPVIHLVATLS